MDRPKTDKNEFNHVKKKSQGPNILKIESYSTNVHILKFNVRIGIVIGFEEFGYI